MKHWHCDHCEALPDYADWEDHLTQSFCRMCGRKAGRLYEYGCFTCDDNGVRFWAHEAPSHECPQCGGDCYRIVEAPYIATGRGAQFKAADDAVTSELERQRASSTSMQRETPMGAPRAYWTQPNMAPSVSGGIGANQLMGALPAPKASIAGTYVPAK